jgi:hypothetical protein
MLGLLVATLCATSYKYPSGKSSFAESYLSESCETSGVNRGKETDKLRRRGGGRERERERQ